MAPPNEEKTMIYSEPTPAMLARAAKEWTALAGGEPVTVEAVGGVLCAFGSELGILRLARAMRFGRAEYSKPRESWYWHNDKHTHAV